MELHDSFNTKQCPVLSDKTEDHQLFIDGKEWTIGWTKHARNRTVDRHNHPTTAAKVLDKILLRLAPVFDKVLDEVDCEFSLRAFPYNSSFVLKVFKDLHTIVVITYADAETFTPLYGDMVISLTERNTVTARRWQKKCAGDSDVNDGKKLLGIVS